MKQPELKLQVTPVWARNWAAIHEQEDGKRKYRYIINEGSSRSSKTYSLIDCCDVYARSYKNKRITIWRDTKTDCKKTVLFDTEILFKTTGRHGVAFNKTESIFTYPTGSTYEIHGTDESNSVHGLTQSVAWLNEPYKISRDVFDQIDQRTGDFIIIDWNPRLSHWIDDLKKDPRSIVIHSTFRDNPFCPVEQKNKILSYQPVKSCEAVTSGLLTEKEANEYSITDNPLQIPEAMLNELSRCRENEAKKSASEYNWQVYGLGLKAERPNRIYRWNEISLNDYLALDVPTYYYSDWGAVDPWAIGEVKYLDGCLYIRELNYSSENTIREKLTPTEREQVNGVEEGVVGWMFNKLGINYDSVIVCDSNRPLKIKALRSCGYDYAIAAVKGIGSIIDGIDQVNNLKVFYTSDSPNIQQEQENYSRQVDRYGIILEEPEDFNNHHMDGSRYVVSFLHQQGIITKV